MKRKLAFFLAAAMTLSMLPVNLYGDSANGLSKVPTTVGAKAVFVESDLLPNSSTSRAGTTRGQFGGNLTTSVVEISDNDDVKFVVDGAYLEIRPSNVITADSTVKLQLENAEWFFRDGGTSNNDKWGKGYAKDTTLNRLSNGKLPVYTAGANATNETLYTLKNEFSRFNNSDVYYAYDSNNYFDGRNVGDLLSYITYSITLGNQNAPRYYDANSNARHLPDILNYPNLVSNEYGNNVLNLEKTYRVYNEDGFIIASYSNLVYTRYTAPYTSSSAAGGSTYVLADVKSSGAFAVAETALLADIAAGVAPKSYRTSGGALSSLEVLETMGSLGGYVSDVTGAATTVFDGLNGRPTVSVAGKTYTQRPIYTLTVSGADAKVATLNFPSAIDPAGTTNDYVTFRDNGAIASDPLVTAAVNRGTIFVPLVVRGTTSETSDIKITLTDNNLTSISGGSWVFGTQNSTLTTTYVDDPQTARIEFPINKLVIKEQRVGSMQSGTVRISTPNGFEFSSSSLDDITIVAENFGYGVSEELVQGVDYTIAFRDSRDQLDHSVIQIEFLTLSENKSSRVSGTMYILDRNYDEDDDNNTHPNHFKIVADDNAAWGDINLTIKNASTSSGSTNKVVTEETFIAGTRKDWTINFEALGTIPTLVSGRYYDDDALDADDETHLAATVLFEENTIASWFSLRDTVFELPEGVKFRKVEITDADEVVQEEELINDDRGITLYEEAFYMNSGKRDGYVTITGNTMTWSNLTVKANEKASIKMKVWVSIASGYEGDVTMTATGTAIDEEDLEIVIAKAVNPVDIVTSVTDIKIGYQYYPVADIEIVETAAGMLEKNKQVWMSVTDLIYMDMYFTPGFTHEVTEGNIKIKNVELATGSKITVTNSKIKNVDVSDLGSGTISFDVDGASSTASTIKFSNLQLKVDRTVPESSQDAYSVYVWGPNVAPNADIFDYDNVINSRNSSNYIGNDQHNSLGIYEQYARVVTSANDRGSLLSSVVKVTAGSTTAYVNGEAMTVDPAPFNDAATSRMMVPVRAVSKLLGVSEELIIWSDPDRTVTVNMPNRTIQFVIGSDLMLINGAQVRMDTQAMIVDGRTFIPVKYLGDALGVTVSYDDPTKTATYNAELEEK